MASNKRNLSLLIVLIFLGTSGAAEAQAPVGTRAAGLAGAFVGVADDASAVYWNPAGLATGPIVSGLATFADEITAPDGVQPVPGERHTATMVALSLPPIGLAYYRLGTYGADAAPAVTGLQSREEVRRSVHALTTSTLAVSLLHSLTDYLVVGVTPKVVWGGAALGTSAALGSQAALDEASELDREGTTVFDVDAGVMFAMLKFRLGLVARNLTTPSFAVADGHEIEQARETRAGAAWGSGWPGYSRLVVAVDGDLESRATPFGERRDLAAGVETWWIGRRLGVRGGLRGSTIGETREAVTAGVSVGLTAGMLVEAHVVRGDRDERGWSVGARFGF
jgi:hypothetical protein